jgi:hypothetical protein
MARKSGKYKAKRDTYKCRPIHHRQGHQGLPRVIAISHCREAMAHRRGQGWEIMGVQHTRDRGQGRQ